jgi:hypothetical protein
MNPDRVYYGIGNPDCCEKASPSDGRIWVIYKTNLNIFNNIFGYIKLAYKNKPFIVAFSIIIIGVIVLSATYFINTEVRSNNSNYAATARC